MWPTEQNRKAWEERYGRRAGERLPDIVRDRLPNVKGKHVLHLPCGTGEVTAELVELGGLVTGIDPDEQALAAARERAPEAAFFQADLHELPLQLRRGRFSLVYAGTGVLSEVRELDSFASAVAAALRKNGELILYDLHPVAACIEPVGLRWRESYFAEGRRRLGEVVVAFVEARLVLRDLEELPPSPTEAGGSRLDPRIPTNFLLRAAKLEGRVSASSA